MLCRPSLGVNWTGALDGSATQARFLGLQDMAVSPEGVVYTTERDTVRKVTPVGDTSTLAGRWRTNNADYAEYADGAGSAARFSEMQGIALDAEGNLYVADTGNRAIRKVTSSGMVSTIAGRADRIGYTDGPLAQAAFTLPLAVAVDAAGAIYVLDAGKTEKAPYGGDTFIDAYVVRKISQDGMVSTVPGGVIAVPGEVRATFGGQTSIGDTLRREGRLAVDGEGNIFVSLTQWPRYSSGFPIGFSPSASYVQKITPAGVSTILAGSRALNSGAVRDGMGGDARFGNITSLSVDASGVLYAADGWDSPVIRRIDRDGEVSTVFSRLQRATSPELFEQLKVPTFETYGLYPSYAVAGPGGSLYLGVTPSGSFVWGAVLVKATRK